LLGYPEGHMDNTDVTSTDEIQFLKEKIEAGADFVLTQLFYDVNGFLAWEKQCRAQGIICPIIPGIMPIQSYNGFRRITSLAKIRVPAEVTASLDPIKVIRTFPFRSRDKEKATCPNMPCPLTIETNCSI